MIVDVSVNDLIVRRLEGEAEGTQCIPESSVSLIDPQAGDTKVHKKSSLNMS
jgi:hypothetical protein